MESQVVVPLEASPFAEAILPHALFFAQHTQSYLTLLRIIMPPGEPEFIAPYIPDDWYSSEISWTKDYLSSIARRLQRSGVRVQMRHLEETSAGPAITSYAEQQSNVELIALATHGRDAGGRLLFGSVAEVVFATAPTSLLILHPEKDEHVPAGSIVCASYNTIMVPLDGTAPSERVLQWATTLALTCHASVLLVATEPSLLTEELRIDEIEKPLSSVRAHEEMKQEDFLAERAEQLRTSTGLSVQTAVLNENPEAFIERFLGKQPHELLIVTTRNQTEHKVMTFLHQSHVPVLFLKI